ncbi:hypothetical protein, partial [Poseidonibacter ostreae]
VITFDSNGLSTAAGDIYTVTLTGVKNITLAQVFGFKDLTSTITWDNIGDDNIVSLNEKSSYTLSGTISNPSNLTGLQITSIVFRNIDTGQEITVNSNLPMINTTGDWSLNSTNMPDLADGRYTVTTNYTANGGYTKSIDLAKPVVVDTKPTITIKTGEDEYINNAESSVN